MTYWSKKITSYYGGGIEWSFEVDEETQGRFRIKFGRRGEKPVTSTIDLGRRLAKRERGSSGGEA
jgi:hypothetical protein